MPDPILYQKSGCGGGGGRRGDLVAPAHAAYQGARGGADDRAIEEVDQSTRNRDAKPKSGSPEDDHPAERTEEQALGLADADVDARAAVAPVIVDGGFGGEDAAPVTVTLFTFAIPAPTLTLQPLLPPRLP